MNTKRGFSLIEILLTIAIIGLLLGVSLTVFPKTSNQQTLNKESAIVLTYINNARNKALTSYDNSEFGIHIASTSLTLFEGKTYVSTAPTNVTYVFSRTVTASPISFTGNVTDIYFKRISGEPSATGTITLMSASNNQTKIITIRGTGIAEVQ